MRHGVIVLTLSSNRQAYVKKSVLDHNMNFKGNNRKKRSLSLFNTKNLNARIVNSPSLVFPVIIVT